MFSGIGILGKSKPRGREKIRVKSAEKSPALKGKQSPSLKGYVA